MSNERYDLLVFIGRFQPFHLGHKRVVQQALKKAHHVLILVGSSYQPRTIRNPFKFHERAEMIMASLDPQDVTRLSIRPLRDHLYNDQKWVAEIQQLATVQTAQIHQPKIGIIGYEKDSSSEYLTWFPQWDFLDVDYDEIIDATAIRDIFFTEKSNMFAEGVLTTDVYNYMFNMFPKTFKKEYTRLIEEYKHISDYKKGWENSPYPPIFSTTDAIIIQSGHILLIQRKASPGAGLFALPGGFLKQDESIENSMIRELREETKLKIPDPVLRGSIKAIKVFDHPKRSSRGRTITNAFLIELAPGKLPPVKGSDDAAKAKWFTLAEFEKMEESMFEDHFQIVNYFLGRI